MSATVGVVIHSDPERFRLTLEALRRNTDSDVEILLLADGPDRATTTALEAFPHVRQSPTSEPQGMAACLNRLFRETSTDTVVLLESGTLVDPGCIDKLISAMSRNFAYGLAGPSTNLCWNEQASARQAAGSPGSIAATSARLQASFGDSVRTLEPLYSLADFCYAVQRRVWTTIGPADERYGLGPCWEMDFNIRAARASFTGIWVRSAYAWRFPFSERRGQSEAALFEINKRLYQSKFCARQIAKPGDSFYRDHCKGDACPNFAPETPAATVITISIPVPRTRPLVTCIMPTHNRRSFIPRTLALFQAQQYEHRELLIFDDGPDSVADLMPDDPTVRYVRLPKRATIGAKRNLACEQARGEIIVHWDDDDWYPADRLDRQVKALLDCDAEVCGTSTLHYYDPAARQAYLYKYGGNGTPWVAGNTLAYRRTFWQKNPFLDLQIGEDARFLWRNPLPRLQDLRAADLCVALLHPGNASPKRINTSYWTPEAVAVVLQLTGDLDQAPSAQPLVSCIMPTRNRRAFVTASLRYFAQQTWPARELLVVDDGEDNIADLCQGLAGVRYLRLPRRMTIGEKRNFACRHAEGMILAHWDDDDWYSPARVESQITPLIEGAADITALECSYVYRVADGGCWTISPELHRRMFVGDVHGGTLVYRRAVWDAGIRYPAVDLAEDAVFLRRALAAGRRLAKLPNPGLFVYVRHADNTWRFQAGSFLEAQGWTRIPPPGSFRPPGCEAAG